MTRREKLIDHVDMRLHQIMMTIPETPEFANLYMAVQRARGISYSMLPESRKKELNERN